MPTEKKVVQYTFVTFWGGDSPVGNHASVVTVDHPGPFYYGEKNGDTLDTSRIVSYDETTEIFETQNTVYVPAGPGLTN